MRPNCHVRVRLILILGVLCNELPVELCPSALAFSIFSAVFKLFGLFLFGPILEYAQSFFFLPLA